MLAKNPNGHSDPQLVEVNGQLNKNKAITLHCNPEKEEFEMPKDLKDIEITKPSILEQFEITDPEKRNFSNNVEILDLIPRYMKNNPKRDDKGRLDPIVAHPKIRIGSRNLKFELTIIPARIKNTGKNKKKYPDLKFIDYYPLVREQDVEMIIRKLGFSEQGSYFDGKAGVFFTISEISKALASYSKSKKAGKVKPKSSYKVTDIKEAIEVLSKVHYELKCMDDSGFPVIAFTQISDSYIQTKEDFNTGRNDSKCFVIQNSLIQKSIENKSLRLRNIERCLGYKDTLATFIDNKIINNFTQADKGKHRNYPILLSTLVEAGALKDYGTTKENKRQLVTALKKMIDGGALVKSERRDDKEIIKGYTCEPKKDGRKTVDWRFALYLSDDIIDEIIEANVIIDSSKTAVDRLAEAKKRIGERADEEIRQNKAEDDFNLFNHNVK